MSILYDVVIVGGGPAGLSAALTLGRAIRKVLIFDNHDQRNLRSRSMNGYLSRDGIKPTRFLDISRKELQRYGVSLIFQQVDSIEQKDKTFVVCLKSGETYESKKVLIATGIVDNIPSFPGINKYYGKSIHHCPYCDGWESRDQNIAIYGKGLGVFKLALKLTQWSNSVSIIGNGELRLSATQSKQLEMMNIKVFNQRIQKLSGEKGKLNGIVFSSGETLLCEKIFLSTGFRPSSLLAETLGCRVSRNKEIWVNRLQETSVRGIYVSGDAAYDMKMVIIAAAEGVKAAVAINNSLLDEKEELVEKVAKISARTQWHDLF